MGLPSVDSLRCFAAAARTLNFRAAARAVFLTPQAFTQRIQSLEGELGAKLFSRTTRSVQLTPAGLRLVPRAEAALQAVAGCAQIARGEEWPQTALLLGTRLELGLSWLEPCLTALRRELPWLELHLYFGSGSDILNRVRSGEADCAVTSARLSDSALEGLVLHREDYVFVGSARRLRAQPLRTAADAAKHVLLDIDGSLPLFEYWRSAYPGEPLRFLRTHRLGAGEAVRRRVLAGDGVAVIPEYMARAELRSGRLQRLFPRVTPHHDFFRLVLRGEDARRPLFDRLAAALRALPVR